MSAQIDGQEKRIELARSGGGVRAAEMAVLVRHGGALLEVRLDRYAPELV